MAALKWLVLAALVAAVPVEAAAQDITPGLLDALRAGGFNLYFRHADTDHSRQDQRGMNLDDCTQQRLLSDKGRDHSRAIGEVIRGLGIPIGVVLASPLCRTLETATLVFGKTERSMAVREGGPLPPGETGRYEPLRRLLSTIPPPGTNSAIVGHAYPMYTLIGGQYLEEGEAAVVRPDGSAFQVVARVGLKEWRALGSK